MNREDARAALDHACTTIGVAADLIRSQEALLKRFMDEARLMDSVGPILDPTLWSSSERRATEAIVKPLFEAALTFLDAHTRQIAMAKAALEKVRRHG